MNKPMNPDEFIDLIQKAIDMIRTYGIDEDDRCDAWEKRLYAWNDAILEITASIQEQYKETGENGRDLTPEEAAAYQDCEAIRDEVFAVGNAIFKEAKGNSE